MRLATLVILASLVPRTSAAQAPSVPASGNPSHILMRAAGMPLHDGALPPGILTVRIVQGAFTNNLPDRTVTVEIAGGGIRTAQTGADGRVHFAHLPVGGIVKASAVAGGQTLESEQFKMPAESGVRILLVAGGADMVPEGLVAHGSPASEPRPGVDAAPARTVVVPPVQGESSTPIGVVAVRAGLVSATALVVVFLFVQRRTDLRRRGGTSETSADGVSPPIAVPGSGDAPERGLWPRHGAS